MKDNGGLAALNVLVDGVSAVKRLEYDGGEERYVLMPENSQKDCSHEGEIL